MHWEFLLMTKTDAAFLKQFSQIIGGLVAFTFVLILYALYVHNKFYADPERGLSTEREQAMLLASSARIAPVGAVFAGETGRAAQLAAEKAAAEAAAKLVAYEGTLDGAVIYGKLCTSCHTNGAGGAPMLTNAAVWAPRVAAGEATLVKHAIEGYKGSAGIMPPRGGNPSLNDAQVEATVKWMLSQLK
jgi:cytochrome c5